MPILTIVVGCKAGKVNNSDSRNNCLQRLQHVKTSLGCTILSKTLHTIPLILKQKCDLQAKNYTPYHGNSYILFSTVINQRKASLAMPKHTVRTGKKMQLFCDVFVITLWEFLFTQLLFLTHLSFGSKYLGPTMNHYFSAFWLRLETFIQCFIVYLESKE